MYPQIDPNAAGSSLEQQVVHYMDLDLAPEDMLVDTARYFDADFAAQEQSAVWDRTWQVACREADVPEPGSTFEYQAGRKSYVVVRQGDGSIKAFHNACRHRGNRLCVGAGKGRTLTCPYHLWQYDLDGRLRHASDPETFIGLDPAERGLKAVATGVRWGFVFINPDSACEPLDDFLGALGPFVDRFRPDAMVAIGMNGSAEIACNWKIVVEAFEESYHIQGVHPQNLPMSNDVDRRFAFQDPHRMFVAPFGSASPRLGEVTVEEVIEGIGYMEEVFKGPGAPNPMEPLVAAYRDADGTISLPNGVTLRDLAQQAERKRSGQPGGPDYSRLTDAQLTDATHISLFPNTVCVLRADELNLFRIRPHQDGSPERCILDFATFRVVADPDERRRLHTMPEMYGPEQSMGLAIDQDREMMPRQHIGLRSHDFGPLILSRQEVGIAHFHAMLDRAIARHSAVSQAKAAPVR